MTTNNSNAEVPIAKTACDGALQDPTGYPSALFKGELVYFCNIVCQNAFMQAPEAFMAGEIEHPLEDETAGN